MLKSSKKVDTNRYELEITIDKEQFADAVMKAYRKAVKNINVPGFRKGKAPKNIIEKMYGESVFYEDALDILYPEAVEGAIKEADLKFVDDKIDFDLVSIGKEGVEFKVRITVYPEVTVADYKGITVEKNAVSVTAKEVEEEINRLAERNARMVSVEDRAAEMGDTAVIDFEGSVDGTPFDGGKGEAFSLGLGSGQFIPGFEEQVAGHNIGEEFDVNVTFPEEYQAEELAGKAAVFKVKLHEIKKREVPAIDDEFAKDVSEFDTLKELKADLKKKALERKNKAADEAVENNLVQQIVESIKGDIPEAMFTNRLNQCVEDFAYRLQSQGMSIDLYLQYTGSTIEQFRETFRPQAEMQVKYRLALEKIVALEEIKADAAAIDAEYAKLAEGYGVEIDKVKAVIPQSEVEKDVAVSKAIDLIKENAVITDAAPQEEKPAAKQAAATKKAETVKDAE